MIASVQGQRGGAIALPAGWTPASISGLMRWWSADFGCLNAAGGACANNDPCKTWNEQSSNASNALQATTANMFTYKTNIQNGLPGLLANGTSNLMTFTTFDLPNFTVAVVAQPTTPGTNSLPGPIHMHVSGQNGFHLTNDNNTASFAPVLSIWNGTSQTSSNKASSTWAWGSTYQWLWDSSPLLDLNGANQAIATRSGTWAGSTGTIGKGYSVGAVWKGYLFSIIIYDSILSALNRTYLDLYRRNKWAAY